MNSEMQTIPNIKIEKIGGKNSSLKIVKGIIELPCWNGYYLYDDSYKLIKEKVVTAGRIALEIEGGITLDDKIQLLKEQADAYFYLIKNQQAIKDAMLEGLKQHLPAMLENEYSSWDHANGGFPRLTDLNPRFEFKDFIGPEYITISEDAREGIAYIQWRFRCRWDVEHGLDIIMHKERIIEIAPDADICKIYEDNDTLEQRKSAYKNEVPILPKKKKWWQFW